MFRKTKSFVPTAKRMRYCHLTLFCLADNAAKDLLNVNRFYYECFLRDTFITTNEVTPTIKRAATIATTTIIIVFCPPDFLLPPSQSTTAVTEPLLPALS